MQSFILRKSQREVLKFFYKYIDCNILFTAPTGWGKTLVVLKALKDLKRLPALWLVRSLEIGFRILEDSHRISLDCFISAGRKKTCPLILNGEIDSELAEDYCRLHRFQCKFFIKTFRIKMPKNVSHYKTLIEGSKKEGFCPYYLEDLIDADIIVQNYFRAKRRFFKAVVIDECHNIFLPRMVKMNVEGINDAILLIKMYDSKLVRKVVRMKQYIDEIGSGNIYLNEFLKDMDILRLKQIIFQLKNFKGNTVKNFKKFIRILNSDVQYIENNKIIGIIASRIFFGKPVILMTGTWFKDMDKFLPPSFHRINVDIPVKKKLDAIIIDDLTTRYYDFDYKMIEEYKKFIINLKLKAKDKRILMFGSERVIRYFINLSDLYEPARIPKNWQGIIMLKARGRYAEGVDIPADIVVMLGCPFMPPEVISRLSKIYGRMGFDDPWSLAAAIPMLITTLQCIGRAKRDPKQRPKIILADERYKRYIGQLSRYLNIDKINI